MITLAITDEQRSEAEKHYDFGALNNSIMKGGSNIYGAIGEIVFRDFCLSRDVPATITGHKDYDLIVKGLRVEVKTKKVTTKPRDYYNVSVAATNIMQQCDHYLFMRVMADKSTAYILGYKSRSQFFTEAAFNIKGEVDMSDSRGFTFKADCFNLQAKHLTAKFKH